jgi:hypothetical protein
MLTSNSDKKQQHSPNQIQEQLVHSNAMQVTLAKDMTARRLATMIKQGCSTRCNEAG